MIPTGDLQLQRHLYPAQERRLSRGTPRNLALPELMRFPTGDLLMKLTSAWCKSVVSPEAP